MGLWLFLFNFFVSDCYQHANFLGTLFNNKVLGVSVPQGIMAYRLMLLPSVQLWLMFRFNTMVIIHYYSKMNLRSHHSWLLRKIHLHDFWRMD